MPLDERRAQRRNWRDGHAVPHRYPGHGDPLTLSMPSRAGPVGTSAYAGIGVAGRPGDTGSGEVDDGALAAPRWASRGRTSASVVRRRRGARGRLCGGRRVRRLARKRDRARLRPARRRGSKGKRGSRPRCDGCASSRGSDRRFRDRRRRVLPLVQGSAHRVRGDLREAPRVPRTVRAARSLVAPARDGDRRDAGDARHAGCHRGPRRSRMVSGAAGFRSRPLLVRRLSLTITIA